MKPKRFKKTYTLVFCLVAGIGLWWAITINDSNYRAIDGAKIKFANLTINSSQPKRLAEFYQQVFTAQPLLGNNPWLNPAAQAGTTTLTAPGYLGPGPTLTFRKVPAKPERHRRGPLQAYDHGYAHICFEADNMLEVIERIQAHGGVISSTFTDMQKSPVIYAKDPDGNVLEVHIPLPSPMTPQTLFRAAKSLFISHFKIAGASSGGIRFLHVNANTANWKKTMGFYQQVFGLQKTGAERDYKGEFIVQLTGIPGAEVRGQHMALPGYSIGGPTLEIFHYKQKPSQGPLRENDLGFISTGFEAKNVAEVVGKITKAGGQAVTTQSKHSVGLFVDTDGNLFQIIKSVK